MKTKQKKMRIHITKQTHTFHSTTITHTIINNKELHTKEKKTLTFTFHFKHQIKLPKHTPTYLLHI